MELKQIFPALAAIGLVVFEAGGAETITGRVVNTSAVALAEAKVWIKSRPEAFDSTGADGKFSLALGTTAIRALPSSLSGDAVFRLLQGKPVLSLRASRLITVELSDIRGKRVAMIHQGRLGPGEHAIAATLPRLRLAAGEYVLGVRADEAIGSTHVSVSPGNGIAYSQASPAPEGRAGALKSTAAEDTLIVLRMGHEIRKIPLAATASLDVGDVGLKVRSYVRDAATAVTGSRRVEVYVPSDYKELYLLPVLYLLHGGGANETYWRANCRFLDSINTYADRVKVQPMIIVTPSAGGNTNYGHYGKSADPFYSELTTAIRLHIESHYKADTSRFSRAISGLSMGSMQTWNLTLFYPELWGYSLPMSGGLFKSTGFSRAKMKSDVAGKLIDVVALNEMKLFKVYSNPTDAAYGDTDTTSMVADSLGIRHTKDFTTRTMGGHTDPYWNEVFRKFAPLLFK